MRCIFYILLFSLFIICSCNTKDEAVKPIPDCSEKGMCEIMTCKVDGKDWYSDCKPDLFFGCDPVFSDFNLKATEQDLL